MEHAIGTRITLPDGRQAEVVEKVWRCEGCIFKNEVCFNLLCFAEDRTDQKNIIYKEIKDMDTSYEKYLQEKARLEAYGHTSVITYEEWKEIKKEETK